MFNSFYMHLPSKHLEQIAFIRRPKIEEHLLIFVDESFHERINLNHYKLVKNSSTSCHFPNWL